MSCHTCNGVSDLESGVGEALEEDEGHWSGRLRWSPFDGISRAWNEDVSSSRGRDDIETSGLSEDAGGGGQSQKAGLDE